MMTSKRIYLPPNIEMTHRRMRLRWQLALASPLAYLLMAQFLRIKGWLPGAEEGFPYDQPLTRLALGIGAAGCIGAIGAFRVHQRRETRRRLVDSNGAVKTWVRDFHMLIVLVDTVAFLAFIQFALSGKLEVMMIGGALAYAGYLAAYPRRDDLAGLPDIRQIE